MIGVLNRSQIDQVLYMQTFGRLACQSKGRLYVVPISYAFDGKYLYAHSREGMKIDMLRDNPSVCFQTDVMEGLASWRSVIVWGTYKELVNARDQNIAIQLLDDRFGPLHVSQSISRPAKGTQPPQVVEKKKKAVYFRISIDEVSGRFERPS